MSHIVVWRPSPTSGSPFGYWHHGVLCPDQTVIHYSRRHRDPPPQQRGSGNSGSGGGKGGRKGLKKMFSAARIEQTTLRNFVWTSGTKPDRLTSTSAFIVRHASQLDPHSVVRRARSRLGHQRYDVLLNNCEHFARWCVLGSPAISTQSAAALTCFAAGYLAAGPVGALAATTAERCITGVSLVHPNFVPLHHHYATGYIHYPQPREKFKS